MSKIVHLPKISNATDFSDYHPIAILPCLSKAFEVCMRCQMVIYLMLNKLLDPLQPGPRLIIVRRPDCSRLSMISVGLLILSVALFSHFLIFLRHLIPLTTSFLL
jgi:hypothetical protein